MITHPFISLSSKTALSKEAAKCWFKCCLENLPSGLISATEITADNKTVRFYHRKDGHKHLYITSLSRNLGTDEAGDVAKSFSSKQGHGEFEVGWSQDYQDDPKFQTLSEDLLKAITLEAARMNHNKWVQTRMDEGWRYGHTHSNRGKTSPICQSWDTLPNQYKRAEFTRIQTLLEVFSHMKLKLIKL